jgi:hypothetical protein
MVSTTSRHPVIVKLRRDLTERTREFAWTYFLKYDQIERDAPAEQSGIAKDFIALTASEAIQGLASEANTQKASLLPLAREAVEAAFVARLIELRNGVMEKIA